MNKKTVATITIIAIILGVGTVIGLGMFKKDTKINEKTTVEQITELLNKKYNKPANSLKVGVLTDTGTFAKGTVNEEGAGGGLWFAAKTSGGWELAYDGNGIIPCEAVNKYNFPKDMIPQCINAQNNLIER